MKGYALPRVFVLSITGEGCQESGEIKVNNSDKCVCICTLPLIAARRSSPRFTLCNNNTNISANNRIVIILTEQPVATAEASLLNVTQVYHRKKKKKKKKETHQIFATMKCKQRAIMFPDYFVYSSFRLNKHASWWIMTNSDRRWKKALTITNADSTCASVFLISTHIMTTLMKILSCSVNLMSLVCECVLIRMRNHMICSRISLDV